MEQKDKELLLRDLCARLPYGVILNCCDSIGEKLIAVDKKGLINYDYDIEEVKPYLFPLSSMTEEEKVIYGDLCYSVIHSLAWDTQAALNELVDWLNEHHFDYRNLIEKGLAIDATNLNIY